MHLTDRGSLLRALFRLCDADADDGNVTEHDDVTLEGVYLLLQQGVEDAQQFLMGAGLGSWWLDMSDVLTFAAEPDGRQWVALPDDFRRLAGDDATSALHDSAGIRWGQEIPAELQRRATFADAYFLAGRRLWVPRGASPPDDLVLDYYRRVGTLADDSPVDFPEEDLALIVAYAALHAREEHWYTGGQQGDQRIARNLESRKAPAFDRARRSLTPKKVKTPLATGDHWAYLS